jgi:hypothetical protein
MKIAFASRLALVASVTTLAIFVAACGGGSSTPSPTPPPTVQWGGSFAGSVNSLPIVFTAPGESGSLGISNSSGGPAIAPAVTLVQPCTAVGILQSQAAPSEFLIVANALGQCTALITDGSGGQIQTTVTVQ